MVEAIRALCKRVMRVCAEPRHRLYIPLLVNFTVEDEEAKGLRAFKDGSDKPPPVYFSALERVARDHLLLLTGPHGSGKSTFACRLARHLAGGVLGEETINPVLLRQSVPRNDEGEVREETWDIGQVVPLYLAVDGPINLADGLSGLWPEAPHGIADFLDRTFLLIVDGAERLGASGPSFMADLADLAARAANLRILVLGEAGVCDDWILPVEFHAKAFLPLLLAQRQAFLDQGVGRTSRAQGADIGHPGLFFLSLKIDGPASPVPYRLVDQWLGTVTADCGRARLADDVCTMAYRLFDGKDPDKAGEAYLSDRRLAKIIAPELHQTFVLEVLSARHLKDQPISSVVRLFHQNPQKWNSTVRVLAQRLMDEGRPLDALVDGLTALDQAGSALGAVLCAGVIDVEARNDGGLISRIQTALLRVIDQDNAPIALRVEVGHHLARWGDPRDLDALVVVPAGTVTMGSMRHANSQPSHKVSLPSFRIGKYPVTNAQYGRFIETTGRLWRSADAHAPARSNVPAVDVTWHDARAYCAWLTDIWRRNGKIGDWESVRLPTEPEWEYAARGDRGESEQTIYPWPGSWQSSRCNSEEARLNDICAVGLFPAGRSVWGCEDMCGQVWEWTTTLWGRDMARPSWLYPYADDGREETGAAGDIRRVLRGGCFSSGKEKACCTYRGSLEPAGFWRGNGFRIVVSA